MTHIRIRLNESGMSAYSYLLLTRLFDLYSINRDRTVLLDKGRVEISGIIFGPAFKNCFVNLPNIGFIR